MALKSNELYKILHGEIAQTMTRLGFKKTKPNLSYGQTHANGFLKVELLCARMAVNVVNEGSSFKTSIGITKSIDEMIDFRRAVRLSEVLTFDERLKIQELNANVYDKRREYWMEWARTQPEPTKTAYLNWDPEWSRNRRPPEKMAENLNFYEIEYLDKSDVKAVARILNSLLPHAVGIGKAMLDASEGQSRKLT